MKSGSIGIVRKCLVRGLLLIYGYIDTMEIIFQKRFSIALKMVPPHKSQEILFKEIVTACNEVGARLCFHRRAWQGGACVAGGVCMAGGVCVAEGGSCVAGGYAWQEGGAMHGGGMHGRRNGHCSGRYASYWNAFLLRDNKPSFVV